jgi:hypothetical protein
MRLKLRVRKTAVVRPVDSKPEGEWWTATSRLSPKQIANAFKQQKVGGILLDTVLDIVPSEDSTIFIWLKMPSHRMDRDGMEVCLSEIGIGLLEPIKPDEDTR